jgi:CheY-like chemotaxis protein
MTAFALLGHDNPYGSYPAPVVPIGNLDGRLVAIYPGGAAGPTPELVETDSAYVGHRDQLRRKFESFDWRVDRLFAFTRDDVTSFRNDKEQEFYSQFLASSKFVTSDRFMRLAFAKQTRNLMFILREMALCSEELNDISPGFVQNWCAKELVELVVQIDLRSIKDKANRPEINTDVRTKPLVLIADDDKGIVEALSYFFSKEGCSVVAARDGAEAIAIATAETPNLILLDLLMPTMSGFEVLAKLKQDPKLSVIPVIILSGVEEGSERERAIDLGANVFIEKGSGFSLRELSKYTQTLLQRSA